MVDVGRVGIWSIGLRNDDPDAADELREAVSELDELGYGAIWLGGSPGVHHAVPLLEATSRIVVATGILNIWEYDPADVAERQKAVSAAHPDRFLLGLGASHPGVAKGYHKPYSAMLEYLDGLDAAGAPPAERVLAALGPRMLQLARDRAAGAHPYLVTPEHTATAREILGPDRLLAPEVKVVLETDPDRARAVARRHLGFYMELPNYTRNLLRLGFTQEDFAEGGSDRLVDATVAWGDPEAIRRRVAAHHDAGADHAALQVLTDDRSGLPRAQWRELAAALL